LGIGKAELSAQSQGGPNGSARTQRDVVVVGASAGGVEALEKLVAGLPAELPASIFVVLHLMADGTSVLPAILDRAGPLRATAATGGERFERGRIYVAPPDRHMLLRGDRIVLTRGPRENGHRPAIDPLFRSAAREHGRRAVGIVLSGMLDDGVLGASAIKRHGGAVLVQDPADAGQGSMPANALEHVAVDHCAPAGELGQILCDVIDTPLDATAAPHEPTTADDGGDGVGELAIDTAVDPIPDGRPAGLICPDCGGALWEQHEQSLIRYECRVGHRYSPESLVAGQAGALEEALWSALHSLEERADLLRRMARRATGPAGQRFATRSAAAQQHAAILRDTFAVLARSPVEPPATDSEPEPAR
jgi:two-component system, chemotaxis family, protein-glutamate methylesterase/glutaminase